ncbi:hypothetical protein ACSSVZ_001643 [Amorphus sp. MBR-141]
MTSKTRLSQAAPSRGAVRLCGVRCPVEGWKVLSLPPLGEGWLHRFERLGGASEGDRKKHNRMAAVPRPTDPCLPTPPAASSAGMKVLGGWFAVYAPRAECAHAHRLREGGLRPADGRPLAGAVRIGGAWCTARFFYPSRRVRWRAPAPGGRPPAGGRSSAGGCGQDGRSMGHGAVFFTPHAECAHAHRLREGGLTAGGRSSAGGCRPDGRRPDGRWPDGRWPVRAVICLSLRSRQSRCARCLREGGLRPAGGRPLAGAVRMGRELVLSACTTHSAHSRESGNP